MELSAEFLGPAIAAFMTGVFSGSAAGFVARVRPSVGPRQASGGNVLALRKVSVHAYEDPGRPEGGHAVLLLHGLETAPTNPTIRLKPADPSSSADAAGWPQGDLKPLAARVTAEGLELQIGPDVTECELLLPGTLVEIEMPSGGVRGEFLWPNVAPVLRPKKRTVIVNKPRRPKDATAEVGSREAATDTPPDATPVPATPAGAVAATAQAGDALPAPAADAPSPLAALSALDALDRIADAALTEPATTTTAAEAAPSSALAALDAIEGIADQAAAQPTEMPFAAQPSVTPAPAPAAVLRGARTTARTTATAANQPADADPAFYPHARAGRVSGAPKGGILRSDHGGRRASNAIQALAGLAAVLAALWVLSRESSMRTVAPQPVSDGSSIILPSSTSAPPPVFSARPAGEPSLFDILSVGAISPRGSSAATTPSARALENANAQLSGVNRDTEEGAFWLRRYITGTIGNDRTLRALTQLGSVYAEPGGGAQPDYAKARALWELAGAAGDPVAMCFLGLLSENGLGGPVDRAAALQWYERSKQAGGCPQVDASIARLKQ